MTLPSPSPVEGKIDPIEEARKTMAFYENEQKQGRLSHPPETHEWYRCATALVAAARQNKELREALAEMTEASAAMMRVINNAVPSKADIIDDLEDEFKAADIKDGFGVRAHAALKEPTSQGKENK